MAIMEKKGIKVYPFSAATGEGTEIILKKLIEALSREKAV